MKSSANAFLFRLAGIGALVALAANILDVVLGFGSSEVTTYGTKTALEWFSIYRQNWFSGMYALGIFNLVYMVAMIPVYLGLIIAHLKKNGFFAILAGMVFVITTSSYLAVNAAIPMYVLSQRFTSAATDVQKSAYLSAAEAILARGEDFTPGTFLSLFLGGLAAISISIVMLKGKIFGKINAWIGIVGFTFLSLFTFLATFVPSLYYLAFYVFGSLGGILALIWFILVALRFFKLAKQP